MSADPLSEILQHLRPRTAISIGLDLAGEWSFAFGPPDGIKFNTLRRGACWLRVADGGWHRLEAGDCFLLTRRLPFALARDPALAPADAAILYRDPSGPVTRWNGGGDVFIIGGRFRFDDDHVDALGAALPPLILVRGGAPEASVLRWALDQLAGELDQLRPGSALVSEHLAHLMLVHILRLHMADPAAQAEGWLAALADPRLSRAMTALHLQPARNWTLSELASAAGMSRTVFAERFRQAVGQSPMQYLSVWRMVRARDRLRHSADSIAAIAADAGYGSEAAFSTAFKRMHRASPGQYRRRRDQPAAV